jgi:hypothetical protein
MIRPCSGPLISFPVLGDFRTLNPCLTAFLTLEPSRFSRPRNEGDRDETPGSGDPEGAQGAEGRLWGVAHSGGCRAHHRRRPLLAQQAVHVGGWGQVPIGAWEQGMLLLYGKSAEGLA